MNALLDNVLAFSPAGLAAPESRLERSNEAKYLTGAQLAEFCKTHDIPHELDATSMVLPTPELKDLFKAQNPITPFNELGLQHQGASAVIALESWNKDKPNSLHGHVMSAISGYVAKELGAVTDSVYVQADPELEYRIAFQPKLVEPMTTLLKDQGAAVISSCVNWNDLYLDFEHKEGSQFELFWHMTAFAFTATGNDGKFGPDGDKDLVPFQKHMAFCHAPPLAASVGAVEWEAAREGYTAGFYIPGYSSANGPTFLAPVAPLAKATWEKGKAPEAVTGSSAAEPYAAGIFAALNKRFGSYLTREQILFAVIATCDKTVIVHKFGKHTPDDYSITYKPNAAGHSYNDGPGGFGMINPYRAHALMAQMVARTQKNPDLITVPTEVRVECVIPEHPEDFVAPDGFYYYDIELPAGYALKTTIEAQFTNAPCMDVAHGRLRMRSPSGTEMAMTTSRSYKDGVFNGLSTTHGFTGEPTQGIWRVQSTEPIKHLRISAHRFLEGDIIHQLGNIQKLTMMPLPSLKDAIPLVELKQDLRAYQTVAVGPQRPQQKQKIQHPHVKTGVLAAAL